MYNEKCDSICKIINEICFIIFVFGKYWFSVLKCICIYFEVVLFVVVVVFVVVGVVFELFWVTILFDWSLCFYFWFFVIVEVVV